MQNMNRMKRRIGAIALSASTAVLLTVATAHGQVGPPEQAVALKASIATVDVEIRATEAENAKYEGGLVKALIESRLATLRQTHAMLDQRANAWTFGIALKYMVDGNLFVLPPTAKDELAAVERELTGLDAEIAAAGGSRNHITELRPWGTIYSTSLGLLSQCTGQILALLAHLASYLRRIHRRS